MSLFSATETVAKIRLPVVEHHVSTTGFFIHLFGGVCERCRFLVVSQLAVATLLIKTKGFNVKSSG